MRKIKIDFFTAKWLIEGADSRKDSRKIYFKNPKTAKGTLFCMPSNGIKLHFLSGQSVCMVSE